MKNTNSADAKAMYTNVRVGDEDVKIPSYKVEEYAMMESELLSKIYKDVVDTQYPLDSNVVANLQAEKRGYDPLGAKAGILKPTRKGPKATKKRATKKSK